MVARHQLAAPRTGGDSGRMEHDNTTKRLFIIGLGYSARAIARKAMDEGWEVLGTTRDAVQADKLRDAGFQPVIWSGAGPLPGDAARATHLLSSVAPDRSTGEDPALRWLAPDSLRGLSWIGYLSSTSVYGDHEGGWVDETTPCDPQSRTGRARLDAENGWLALGEKAGVSAHVFRLSGIYGPGRSVLERLLAGTSRRIIKPGQVFSRVHTDDIAQTVLASMRSLSGAPVYNLCDDEPAPPQDVIAHAAGLLGMDVPPDEDFDAADLSPMARFFFADSKRVRNDLIKDELGIRLIHPSYREGLADILRRAS